MLCIVRYNHDNHKTRKFNMDPVVRSRDPSETTRLQNRNSNGKITWRELDLEGLHQTNFCRRSSYFCRLPISLMKPSKSNPLLENVWLGRRKKNISSESWEIPREYSLYYIGKELNLQRELDLQRESQNQYKWTRPKRPFLQKHQNDKLIRTGNMAETKVTPLNNSLCYFTDWKFVITWIKYFDLKFFSFKRWDY